MVNIIRYPATDTLRKIQNFAPNCPGAIRPKICRNIPPPENVQPKN